MSEWVCGWTDCAGDESRRWSSRLMGLWNRGEGKAGRTDGRKDMRGGEVGSGEYSRGRILFVAVRGRRGVYSSPSLAAEKATLRGWKTSRWGGRKRRRGREGPGRQAVVVALGPGGGVRPWSYAAKLAWARTTGHRELTRSRTYVPCGFFFSWKPVPCGCVGWMVCSQKILQNFSDFPSHRIFIRMHGVLNIDENKS